MVDGAARRSSVLIPVCGEDAPLLRDIAKKSWITYLELQSNIFPFRDWITIVHCSIITWKEDSSCFEWKISMRRLNIFNIFMDILGDKCFENLCN